MALLQLLWSASSNELWRCSTVCMKEAEASELCRRPVATLLSWAFPTWAIVATDRNTMFPELQKEWDMGEAHREIQHALHQVPAERFPKCCRIS